MNPPNPTNSHHAGLRCRVVRRTAGQKGCHLLLKLWIVERSVSWLVKPRRLARDYETRLPSNDKNFCLFRQFFLHCGALKPL